jgi:hypothetical protein
MQSGQQIGYIDAAGKLARMPNEVVGLAGSVVISSLVLEMIVATRRVDVQRIASLVRDATRVRKGERLVSRIIVARDSGLYRISEGGLVETAPTSEVCGFLELPTDREGRLIDMPDLFGGILNTAGTASVAEVVRAIAEMCRRASLLSSHVAPVVDVAVGNRRFVRGDTRQLANADDSEINGALGEPPAFTTPRAALRRLQHTNALLTRAA